MFNTLKLFVGGLPTEIASEELLVDIFTSIGASPTEVRLLPLNATGPNSRRALVRVEEDIAEHVIEAVNGTPLPGYYGPLVVRKAAKCDEVLGGSSEGQARNWWEREGNWACDQCANVNFAHRERCNRCGQPKSAAATAPALDPRTGSLKTFKAPVAGVNGSWTCPACSNVNFALREACHRCQEPKPLPAGGSSARAAEVAGGTWTCQFCSNVNGASCDACNRCFVPNPEPEQTPPSDEDGGAPADGALASAGAGAQDPFEEVDGGLAAAPPDEAWDCPRCSNVNPSGTKSCLRCQARRRADDGGPEPASGRGPPVEGVGGNWRCGLCANVNLGWRGACNRCQAGKPGQDGGLPAAAPGEQGGEEDGRAVVGPRASPRGPGRNLATTPKSAPPKPVRAGRQGPAEGVDGNWRCSSCDNINFQWRRECNRCQAPKPEDTPPENGWATPAAASEHAAWAAAVDPGTTPIKPLKPPSAGAGPAEGVDGNWKCKLCLNINYGTREACNRCRAPRGEDTTSPSAGQLRGGPGPSLATGFTQKPKDGADGNWKCRSCGNVNLGWRELCNRCQLPPQGPPADGPAPEVPLVKRPQAPVEGVDGNWRCPACSNINYGTREACNRCQLPRGPPADGPAPGVPLVKRPQAPVEGVDGNWRCPACSNINYGTREACNRCQLPRPAPRATPQQPDEEADFGSAPPEKRARTS